MKILDKASVKEQHQVNVNHALTECRVLRKIKHPFVVKLRCSFRSATRFHVVLDYCSGGDLFYLLERYGRLPEELARFYAAELTLALGHLHLKHIVHRDLKPENVLLDGDGHVRLADFGLAKEGIELGHAGAHSFCGTVEYMAPEIHLQNGHGTGVDWWALGIMLHEMLTGSPPWYTHDQAEMLDRVINARLEIPERVSADARSIMADLLRKNPLERLGVRGGRSGVEVLRHPFFGCINWKFLYARRVPPPYKRNMPAASSKLRQTAALTHGADSLERQLQTGPAPPAVPMPAASSASGAPIPISFIPTPDLVEKLTVNCTIAITARADPDNENIHQQHIRIGSGMAAEMQMQELSIYHSQSRSALAAHMTSNMQPAAGSSTSASLTATAGDDKDTR